jgi:hypothetical protein
MKKRNIILILVLTASGLFAQGLTPAQKESDFRYLASLYSTYYSGYDWKKLVSGRKLWNFSKHEYDAWRAAL